MSRHVAVRLRARARVEGCGHAPSEGRSALSGGERAVGGGAGLERACVGVDGDGAGAGGGVRAGLGTEKRGGTVLARRPLCGAGDRAVGPLAVLVGGGLSWRGSRRRNTARRGTPVRFPREPGPTGNGPGCRRVLRGGPGPWAETGHACAPTGGLFHEGRCAVPLSSPQVRRGAERGPDSGSVETEAPRWRGRPQKGA